MPSCLSPPPHRSSASPERKGMVPPATSTRSHLNHQFEKTPDKPSPVTVSKRARNVHSVVLGDRLVAPSCSSNYPEDIVSYAAVPRLFVCERCFKYTVEPALMVAHKRFCQFNNAETPVPGRVVYEENKYSIWEVDGEEEPLFTQNLSLFAKLFIESKMVCFDIQGFLYYILVANEPETIDRPKANAPPRSKLRSAKPLPQIVGYYSKEKLSWDNHNLACILVFPPWQRLGLGSLLMKVSYAMAKREKRLGGPEKPLSTVGAMSYHSYWSRTLVQTLLALPTFSKRRSPKKVSLHDLSEETFFAPDDIVETLQKLDIVGGPRKQDGYLRVDKVKLRKWLDARGLEHSISRLTGQFYEYEDDDDAEEEGDGEVEDAEEEEEVEE